LVLSYRDAEGRSRQVTVRVKDATLLETPLNQPYRFVVEEQGGTLVLLVVLPLQAASPPF
jgi:hypothetical protein